MAAEGLSLRHALTLGLLQGPTELLPISSSAHTLLVPWLAGWPDAELDPELRKAFEVAVHVGGGVALAIQMRGELTEAAVSLDRTGLAVIGLSLAPPVIAGYALQRFIERRLGGPRPIAASLAAGAMAMALADRERAGADQRERRPRASARPRDGLVLGLAQAVALLPGISRSGATLAAARARGFARADADALSWHAALPVILGASALKGYQLARSGAPPGAGRSLLAGSGAAFLSTLLSARLLRRPHTQRCLLICSVYRCLLAALVVRRLGDRGSLERQAGQPTADGTRPARRLQGGLRACVPPWLSAQ
jgi:undecaprenyl-diphosphatase